MERLTDEKRRFKTDTRNLVDVTLLGITITLFGLIVTLRSELLTESYFLGIQLALIVPFFLCGLLSRIKESVYTDSKRWLKLTRLSFIVGYGFFINVVGLTLAFVGPTYLSMSFFAADLLLTATRAGIVISYNPSGFKQRLFREITQLIIIVFLGILPALRIY